VVNALVEATPISGPAWVSMQASAMRQADEPRTLQIVATTASWAAAISMAARVSAVSPLWVTPTTSTSLSRSGPR
jgi:hypothetical protein